jgi:hypothetical protein
MGKPKQHLIPHLIQCDKVAPEVRKRAEAQKAAWAEADARKAAASLQNNAVAGSLTALSLSRLIIGHPPTLFGVSSLDPHNHRQKQRDH